MDYYIDKVKALQVLDSRGFPTVATEVSLKSGVSAVAMVPSGASTGEYEAVELRDNAQDYAGKGVKKAVKNVNTLIAPAIMGKSAFDQEKIDEIMIKLDGTDNKGNLGANAILSVSLAVAKAAAKQLKLPLYRYLGNAFSNRLPVPMMNILNGGAHASNNIDIQEFMVMPVGAKNFSEGLRQCSEIYKSLKDILTNLGKSTAVGDEGGFAPDLESDEQAIEIIMKAIKKAGYSDKNTKIALDAAASEWYKDGVYHLPKRNVDMTTEDLIEYFEKLCAMYPIFSIEDPLSENDWNGFVKITDTLGEKVQIVGDDLFVTNEKRLAAGIRMGAGNAVLVKVNQIGTLTESFRTIENAHRAGYKTIISHRSGETEDTTIADIAVAVNSGQIKTGAPCRAERTAKYNRLLFIENELKENAKFFI
ncbi:MAG: phosphopyruvate hydratase [Eubacteriales bacterium]|nr:phosphopyruvate hydratase [Eubacteriales bacterium]